MSTHVVPPREGGAGIVGVGVVSGYGWGREPFWAGLSSGRSAVVNQPKLAAELGREVYYLARVKDPEPESRTSLFARALLGSVDLNKYAEDGTVLGAVATQLGSSRNQVSWKTFVYANQVAIDDWNNDTRLKLGTPGYEAIDVAQQRAKGIMPVK